MGVVRKKKIIKKKPKANHVAWGGPEKDGITQSLISRFLVCKERFRILAIEGYAPNEGFSAPLHYGQMWHTCEEALAQGKDYEKDLLKYCTQLCKQFPTDQNQVDKWYNVCLKQFPIYVEYWSKHPDVKRRTAIFQEETFCIPYTLPSGKVVKLRGKWDSVDLIGRGRTPGFYLQENKTKGTVDEQALSRQLTFDLQTMMYLIALKELFRMINEEHDDWSGVKPTWNFVSTSEKLLRFADKPVKGVRYNVIRRPLSGGKGSIRQHKPTKANPQGESKEEFYDRLQQYFIDAPEEYFMRWQVTITDGDIQKFKDDFFDPCLEYICLWYRFITASSAKSNQKYFNNFKFLHYRFPYGVWNSVAEGRGSDVEEYLNTGSTAGLKRIKTLFPELE